MSETGEMLIEAATRLLEKYFPVDAVRAGMSGTWQAEGWAAIVEMGLPLALVDEAAGGFGLPADEAMMLAQLAGRHALPLPLPETMLAERTLAAAGLPPAGGAASIATVPAEALSGDRLKGQAERVPWARNVDVLVVEAGDRILRLDRGQWHVVAEHENVAGLPRDTISFDCSATSAPRGDGPTLFEGGAAMRAMQIAGALERILEMTVEHVNNRVQFGKPLAKFQAIQQELARVADEAAASSAAAGFAAEAMTAGALDATLDIAVARIRTGEAVGIATRIAHQLHGAIGFTWEHALHTLTRSLWSWRDEFGGNAYWSRLAGDASLAAGADGYWPFITRIGAHA